MKRVQILCVSLLALFVSAGAFAQNAFTIPNEISRNSSMIRNAPTYVDARVLAANIAETVTIPTVNTRWVLFASTCDLYVQLGASAVVPTIDVTNGTASELNPAAWWLPGNETQFTIITSATTCIVTMAFYTGR